MLYADAILHPKEILYLQKNALASNDEAIRNKVTNGMAHISLDGRIMNAVSATCAEKIGGDLAEEEAQAWDCFAPLQRVLIVAVAAAASASTKQKNHKELNRLQRAVHAQVNSHFTLLPIASSRLPFLKFHIYKHQRSCLRISLSFLAGRRPLAYEKRTQQLVGPSCYSRKWSPIVYDTEGRRE